MRSRRWFLTRSAAGVLGSAGLSLCVSGDEPAASSEAATPEERLPDGSASRGMITVRTDLAIQRGLAYLAARKDRDGSYGTGPYRGNVAISSLAAMSMMCAGYQPQRGVYGSLITDCLRYVMSRESRSLGYRGFLYQPNSGHGPMYGHGFATLFLSEVYGMVPDKALRDEVRGKLHRAVGLILATQKHNGQNAWRYTPSSRDADLSVTICQIMALRSARNAGMLGAEVGGQGMHRVRQGVPGSDRGLVPLSETGQRRRWCSKASLARRPVLRPERRRHLQRPRSEGRA